MLGRRPAEGEHSNSNGSREKHVEAVARSENGKSFTVTNTDSYEHGETVQSQDVAASETSAGADGKSKKGRKWAFF